MKRVVPAAADSRRLPAPAAERPRESGSSQVCFPSPDPGTGVALRAQFGVWCCLMLIASPLLWTHYLPLAYWPLAVVADRAERSAHDEKRPSRRCVFALLLWLICVLLLAWPAARAAGAQLVCVAVLWVVVLTLTRPRGATHRS